MPGNHQPRLVAATAAVLLVAAGLAGCLSPGDGDAALALDAIATERTTAPGNTVAFPLAVGPNATSVGQGNLTVAATDAGDLEVDAPDPVSLRENGTGVFLTVHVPEGTDTGDHTVSVEAQVGEAAGPTLDLTVHVEEPDDVVDDGERVSVDYVGRFANGSIFATSIEALNSSAHPKAGIYTGGNHEPLNVTVGPNAPFIQGFNDGIVGLGVGHDASLEVPPGQGYGNATTTETEPRRETLDRVITEDRVFNISRERVAQQGLVNESSEEGDHVTVGSGGQASTYNITFLNETRVELTLVVEEGDIKTHYPQWPDSSEAQSVNETHVEWYVTPTTDEGEDFTYHSYWPNATRLVEITNDTIVLEHTPEEGLTYSPGAAPGGQEAPTRTVVEVNEDEIVVEEENPHPLAGKTLVFDVTVLSAEEAPQQQT